MLYIANISEDDVMEGGHNQYVQLVEDYAAKKKMQKSLWFVRKSKKR